ncbi:coiled-coil domain-containing protein 94 [Biomphalaria glabrata]|uniref:Splicing factor YJU2 n=1 Tax=Biomphalaria glabrata TaxID=6526 RepID=A0A9W3A6P1_BIOGL|nr:splicing factor YJU2-like [Biomphalaria glabrata]XP_055882832.1 splicing factor YJU2-like [Biomphalaria glabrata]KAI8733050.1 coiled-coil domain-containing protein 94-like [Biomphalaria glabrata]
MSERKVLNKYYPPEFDPSKIPKLKQPKNRTFSIRIMAPFNMRCNTCGEYIYKGKKFNSRKENVDNEDYLGLRIFRFYIKCPKCVAEIAFKTDLANTDYALEAGATRLFEAEKLAHQMAEKERKEKEEDELNPMKVLENRTKASRNEMEQLDQLDELREMNARHASVDYESMLKQHMVYEEQLLKLQAEEEDKLVQEILKQGSSSQKTVKRIDDEDSGDESSAKKARQELITSSKATDILATGETKPEEKKKESWQKSVGTFSSKTSLAGLVKRKAPVKDSLISTSSEIKNESGHSRVACHGAETVVVDTVTMPSGSNDITINPVETKPSVSLGLGLLGGYSDSSSDGNDSP